MKRIILFAVAVLSLLCTSCRKEEAKISERPLSINLFLFSRDGADLLIPAQPNHVAVSDISIEAELQGEPMMWESYAFGRYYDDNNSDYVWGLTGFYRVWFFTRLPEGLPQFRNETIECTVHIEGYPDSKVVLYFDQTGWVWRIDINGKRNVEAVNFFEHPVKLTF